jgi:hypothetical protein
MAWFILELLITTTTDAIRILLAIDSIDFVFTTIGVINFVFSFMIS